MEPVWLGIAGLSLGSAVRSVTAKAVQPFDALLESARKLAGHEEESESAKSRLHPSKNPHSLLMTEFLTGEPSLEDAGEIDFGDIRYRVHSLQQDLEQRIAQVLQDAGIEFQGKAQISISPRDGSLELTGDLAQCSEIEQALASDSTIAADFRQLSALKSLLSAAEQNSAFEDAYELDPFQAVEDFPDLFQSNQVISLTGTSLLVELSFDS